MTRPHTGAINSRRLVRGDSNISFKIMRELSDDEINYHPKPTDWILNALTFDYFQTLYLIDISILCLDSSAQNERSLATTLIRPSRSLLLAYHR